MSEIEQSTRPYLHQHRATLRQPCAMNILALPSCNVLEGKEISLTRGTPILNGLARSNKAAPVCSDAFCFIRTDTICVAQNSVKRLAPLKLVRFDVRQAPT